MSAIFPGMDPYLENPHYWPGVHEACIIYMRNQLLPQLRPRYWPAIGSRVFIEGPRRDTIPDVTVLQRSRQPARGSSTVLEADAPERVRVSDVELRESFLTIIDRESGQQIVTVIELVSPTNKYAGPGRELYQRKQRETLGSSAHLVEIDLLRAGPHVLAVPEQGARLRGPYTYLVSVNRAEEQRQVFEIYRRTLRDRLPRIRIPLADDDPDVVLDLQAVLVQVCETGGYEEQLNYAAPCIPPLSPEDQAWANQLIAARQVAPPA